MEERGMSNGAASTPYSNGAANGNKASTGLVLARRSVSTLTAVQTAAAGASTALQSRDQLVDVVAAEVRVGGMICCMLTADCRAAGLVTPNSTSADP